MFSRNAAPFEPQLLARLRVFGHGQFHLSTRGIQTDTAAQCSLPRRHRQVHEHIPALDAKRRVLPDRHFEIEIAGFALTRTRRAFSGKANMLATGHTFWDLHPDRALFQRNTPVRPQFRRAKCKIAAAPAVGLRQINDDLCMMVLTGRVEVPLRARIRQRTGATAE